jgi:hypothetical protein
MAGGINSLEPIPRLLQSLEIPSQSKLPIAFLIEGGRQTFSSPQHFQVAYPTIPPPCHSFWYEGRIQGAVIIESRPLLAMRNCGHDGSFVTFTI